MSKIITTSWDDGHPKDFLISELLDKYSLKGLFIFQGAISKSGNDRRPDLPAFTES